MSGAALQWGERIKLVLREPLERSQEITTKLIMEGLALAGVCDFEFQSSARARTHVRALDAPSGVDSQVLSSQRKRIKAVGI